MKENKNEKEQEKQDSSGKFLLALAAVIICSVLFNTYLFQLASVVGSSMYPTLEDGQILIISKCADIDKYQRGDVIIFKHDKMNLIKRLIALPGETIQIKDNEIYINDEKIDDYVDVDMEDIGILKDKITLKENEFFFMGDNRNHSSDCRTFGVVSKDDIVGKIIFRFHPLDTKF